MTTAPNVYLAVGPNCWGRGNTVSEALRNARKNLPAYNLREGALLCVYRVTPEAYVDDFGAITYPTGDPIPEFIKAVPVKINGAVPTR